MIKHTGSFKVFGPWETILGEGKNVFKDCRTGGDLRDKFLNVLPQWLKKEQEALEHANGV